MWELAAAALATRLGSRGPRGRLLASSSVTPSAVGAAVGLGQRRRHTLELGFGLQQHRGDLLNDRRDQPPPCGHRLDELMRQRREQPAVPALGLVEVARPEHPVAEQREQVAVDARALYDAATNTIYEVAQLLGPKFLTPKQVFKQSLTDPHARLEGTRTYKGRSVYVIVIRTPDLAIGHHEIYVMNADGSDEIPLTIYGPNTNHGDRDDPSWSLNGQQITFERDIKPTPSPEVYTMNADGSDVAQLTGLPYLNGHPGWGRGPAMVPMLNRQPLREREGGARQCLGSEGPAKIFGAFLKASSSEDQAVARRLRLADRRALFGRSGAALHLTRKATRGIGRGSRWNAVGLIHE
jgi:hypothetical protein